MSEVNNDALCATLLLPLSTTRYHPELTHYYYLYYNYYYYYYYYCHYCNYNCSLTPYYDYHCLPPGTTQSTTSMLPTLETWSTPTHSRRTLVTCLALSCLVLT